MAESTHDVALPAELLDVPPGAVDQGADPEAKRDVAVPVAGVGQTSPYITRTRAYAFALGENGLPIELGSGRFAKAYLGEERWMESSTSFRRNVAIKILQKGVCDEDRMRFEMEKQILERVQGHSSIIELIASGQSEKGDFIPSSLADKVDNNFMILELLDLSLEERLKGSRFRRAREDLLAIPAYERIFRVLEYVLPVATALEYAHLVRDTCHRDVKPANILLKLPDASLRGSRLKVTLADFNVAKLQDGDDDVALTRRQQVPGTMYFQSPEQETNSLELLVNVTKGSPEIEFFEDFYIDIHENDVFQVFNRPETYPIVTADRGRKKILLRRPFDEQTEQHVRAKVTKAVGRPADIYSLGALLYYLASGAYANPKTLHDVFRKFIEYEKKDENNTVTAYIEHEYRLIQNMRAPKTDGDQPMEVAPDDRFFSYKHYLDGNGELIDPAVMLIAGRAMIRNKPDSYCWAWDLETRGISEFVSDLLALYVRFGVDPSARLAYGHGLHGSRRSGAIQRIWNWARSRKSSVPPE